MRRILCGLDCLNQPTELGIRVEEPIGRPDSVDPPAKVLQDSLAESIPVPCPAGAVITGAVAFDSKHVSARQLCVHHSEVDEEARATHLSVDRVTQQFQLT